MARNTRAVGNRYENEAADQLEAAGYWTFCARGSRTPVDILAVHRTTRQIVAVQIGTENKRARGALKEMREADTPPGTLFVVARRFGGRPVEWKWHYGEDLNEYTYDSASAIFAAKEFAS